MEAHFRKIVSGEDGPLAARLLRPALSALALPYSVMVALRNRLYDTGVLRAHRVGVPVVSIGNITLGGTGKTPFVELLCRWFLARGKRPIILSRGYRSTGEQNDEAMLLRANLPDVPHRQGKDRVALARQTCESPLAANPDVLVLDDGFQHRRLARDLDIVLIDCTDPFGYDRLFPRGMLREPVTNLRRADLIILSRADQCLPEDLTRIRRKIAAAAGQKPLMFSEHRPTVFRSADGQVLPASSMGNRSVAAFCGIGNPTAFWKTLRRLGCSIAGTMSFPDHHVYSSRDRAELAAWAAKLRCDLIVTTQKDHVKISYTELGGRPLLALHIEAAIDDPQGHLDRALACVLSREGTIRDAA